MKRTSTIFAALLAPALFAWTAFAAVPLFAQSEPNGATAELKNAQGQTVGSATFLANGLARSGGGVKVQVTLNGFTSAAAGEHGIHIHAVGMCDAPGFTTAGGHFNPGSKKHGLNNPEGHHAGDMPNLKLDAGGSATYETNVMEITLDAGAANSIFDADGSAVVIHAGPDDMATDPAGNSGARIACGVLRAAYVPVAGMPQTGNGAGQTGYLPWLILTSALVAGGLLITRRRGNAQVR
jgi:superoxide dismutase, Cu-Zn family